MLLQVGAGRTLDYVRRFGFDTRTFPRNTQLAIGGGTMAVTPIDMVRAYAVLANGGRLVQQPHIIKRVQDLNGNVVFEPSYPVVVRESNGDETPPPEAPGAEPSNLEELLAAAATPAEQAIDERNAFIMHQMLRDVVRRGNRPQGADAGAQRPSRQDRHHRRPPPTLGSTASTPRWPPPSGWASPPTVPWASENTAATIPCLSG